MAEQIIYLAGGCYWGAEKYLSSLKGVVATEVGFANGFVQAPSYYQVKHEETGHAETVRVSYDPEIIPLRALVNLFFEIIDPTTVDKQGEDEGHQYRTGIYWQQPEDEAVVRQCLTELRQKVGQPLAVEALPLQCFYPAEEYHQKYLDKNPGGYCHVPFGKIAWAKTVEPKDWL